MSLGFAIMSKTQKCYNTATTDYISSTQTDLISLFFYQPEYIIPSHNYSRYVGTSFIRIIYQENRYSVLLALSYIKSQAM